jgi:integrase
MTKIRRSGLPDGCSWNRNRAGGKPRVRFRKNGFTTYLPDLCAAEFLPAYALALEGAHARAAAPSPEIGAARTLPGSINALIVSYYRLVFPTLAASTQAMRRGILERFREKHGDKPVDKLEPRHVADFVAAKAATPDAANTLRKILRHLLEHAVAINMINNNPVLGVARLKTTGSGHHTWTDGEIAAYRAHWPLGTQQRLAMELALELTTRRSDVVRIGPQHVRGDKLDVRHSKNATENLIPITDELRAAIEACPTKQLTFLHTRSGAPRSPKALGGDFRSWCDAAGLPKHCSLHGLRKGGARRLAESGATAHEIMAITGHKTLSEVQRYTVAAERVRLAEQAMAKRQSASRPEKLKANVKSRRDIG